VGAARHGTDPVHPRDPHWRTPVRIFNHGKMRRDFTYVDDIVEGVVRVLDRPAQPDPAFDPGNPNPSSSSAPYRVYNIGNDQPTELLYATSMCWRKRSG
jgi:UDP-glucuronate 4-epimerase